MHVCSNLSAKSLLVSKHIVMEQWCGVWIGGCDFLVIGIHWNTSVFQFFINCIYGISFALTREELKWEDRIGTYIKLVLSGDIRYSTPSEV